MEDKKEEVKGKWNGYFFELPNETVGGKVSEEEMAERMERVRQLSEGLCKYFLK